MEVFLIVFEVGEAQDFLVRDVAGSIFGFYV